MTTQAGHIVVVGLMGSGKTTLGRALADRLGRRFVDSDATLEDRHRRTARAIAAADGLDRLHELEAETLIEALAGPVPAVVAAAASTIEDPRARERLAAPGVFTLWLRGAPQVLAERAAGSAHRPLVDADAAALLEAQAAIRDPLFAGTADTIIEVDDRTPEGVLDAALAALPGSTGS